MALSAVSIQFSVASVSAASLGLAWDPSPDPNAAGYILSYGPAPGVYSTIIDVGLVEGFEVTGLANDTLYCFVVRAYNLSADMSTPTNEVCIRTPSRSATILVPAGGNLQTAIDAAQPGATIVLAAGATFTGNFVLPARAAASTAYITIRSAAPDSALPANGTRITPAHAPWLPKLRSPNGKPALSVAAGGHHYRLQFLEFLANSNYTGSIIALGDGSQAQNTLSEVPHHLIADRVYIHGHSTRGQERAIALHSASTAIINSHISDIKATGASQAIAGWNGPGPYTISNNYLEAAGQTVQFGARKPDIPLLVPSDITVTGNYFTKRLAWKTQSWNVKALIELRSARRVTIDGNLLENNWAGVDGGFAVRLQPAGSSTSTWSAVQDVEFKNNIVRNVASALFIARTHTIDAAQVSDIAIRNNLFDAISSATHGGLGLFLQIAGASDVTIDHNTVFNDGTNVVYAKTWPSSRFVFTNNIVRDRGAAIGSPLAPPGLPTILSFFPLGQFVGGIYVGANPLLYPVANYYPATLGAVGFVSLSGGDYRLSAASIFLNGGTDGKDPGCNFNLLPVVPR